MVTYPRDWAKKSFNDFIQIKRGASPRPIERYLTSSTNGVNWIKIGDAPLHGKYISSTAEKITAQGASHSVSVHRGDFILSNSMSFGRPYILNLEGCIHDGWLCLYDFQAEANAEFLYYLLSSSMVQKQYDAYAAGSGVQNLNKDVVKKVTVYLPSLLEQKRIAKTLSLFDTYIDDLTELIEKKQNIRDGALEELICGKTTISGFNNKRKEYKISDITRSIITGGTPSTTRQEYYGGNIPWLSSTEIHQKRITKPTTYITELGLQNSSAKIAPEQSVLIALAGQGKTRGTAAYLTKPMALNQSLAALVTNEKCNPEFLYYLISNMYLPLRELSSGDGGRGGLNKKIIEKVSVTIPIDIAEQIAIANTLSAMDEEIEALKAEQEKMIQIREGAMEDLLTGHIRLRIKEENDGNC